MIRSTDAWFHLFCHFRGMMSPVQKSQLLKQQMIQQQLAQQAQQQMIQRQQIQQQQAQQHQQQQLQQTGLPPQLPQDQQRKQKVMGARGPGIQVRDARTGVMNDQHKG